jgi:hypothetical protein
MYRMRFKAAKATGRVHRMDEYAVADSSYAKVRSFLDFTLRGDGDLE